MSASDKNCIKEMESVDKIFCILIKKKIPCLYNKLYI